MIYVVAILIFLLGVYLCSGTFHWIIWKLFGKVKGTYDSNGCKVYLSSNLPLIVQGRFFPPSEAFVKRSYYIKNGKLTDQEFFEASIDQLNEGYQGTFDTVQHETIGHKAQYDRYVKKYTRLIGMIMWYFWALFNELGYWLGIYKVRDQMPIEREPNKAERV